MVVWDRRGAWRRAWRRWGERRAARRYAAELDAIVARHRRAMDELADAVRRAEAWKAIAHELLPAKPAANVVPLRGRPPAS